MKSRQ